MSIPINIISEEDYKSVLINNHHHFNCLIELVKSSKELLEGDCFYEDKTMNLLPELTSKQRNIYSLARISNIVLEIGFNAGHSTLLMLLANPQLNIVCFDICSHKYTEPCFKYLQSQFGNRITLIKGNSKSTVYNFSQTHPNWADLIHIDGSHDYTQANLDFFHTREIAKHGAYIIWDDVWLEVQRRLWDGYKHIRAVKEILPTVVDCISLLTTDKYQHSIGTYFKPRIAICTLALGEKYKQIVKYAQRSKLFYAQIHGYDLHQDETCEDKTRPPAWSKVKLILSTLAKYNYDYVVWIDADAYIMNNNCKLEWLIYDYMLTQPASKDIMISRDWKCPNTGVIFVHNTSWSKLFFECLYAETQFIDDPNWEQTAFIHLYDNNVMNSQSHILIQPVENQGLFNSYWFNYFPSNFILHLPGCFRNGINNGLKEELARFCPLKMDEETDQTYQTRKKWLENPRPYIDDRLSTFKKKELEWNLKQ